MKDELIKYDTAILAKEKGFNISTDCYYRENGILSATTYYDLTPNNETITEEWFSDDDQHKESATCTAPSQSLLQRWLREVHHISIEPYQVLFEIGAYGNSKYIEKEDNEYTVRIVHNGILIFTSNNFNFDSYEQALEAGLVEGLKLIKL